MLQVPLSNKIYFILFLILSSSKVFAQTKYLELTNKETDIVKFIPEHTRVQIKTTSNLKLFGKFKIIDTQHISIKNKMITLEDIEKIKRKTVFGQVVKWILLGGGGLGAIGAVGVTVSGGDIEFIATPLLITVVGLGGFYLLQNVYPYQNSSWTLKNKIQNAD